MQKNKLLSSFEYAVMPSVSSVSISHPAKNEKERYTSLLQVKMNFKNGEFILKGSWNYIMASNTKANSFWLSYHPGRVVIKADLFPGEINLDDHTSDGLVLPVSGTIQDESSVNSCSGLILFHKSTTGREMNHHEWTISVCLYDYQQDNCEINLKLPLYVTHGVGNKS